MNLSGAGAVAGALDGVVAPWGELGVSLSAHHVILGAEDFEVHLPGAPPADEAAGLPPAEGATPSTPAAGEDV